MEKEYLFYEDAAKAAETALRESMQQENLLREEERENLRKQRQEEAETIIGDIKKKSEEDSSEEERAKMEQDFWILQEKAVRLAKRRALNLKVDFEGTFGRLVFSGADILFGSCERQDYAMLRELLDQASLIWLLADPANPGRIQICLEYHG